MINYRYYFYLAPYVDVIQAHKKLFSLREYEKFKHTFRAAMYTTCIHQLITHFDLLPNDFTIKKVAFDNGKEASRLEFLENAKYKYAIKLNAALFVDVNIDVFIFILARILSRVKIYSESVLLENSSSEETWKDDVAVEIFLICRGFGNVYSRVFSLLLHKPGVLRGYKIGILKEHEQIFLTNIFTDPDMCKKFLRKSRPSLFRRIVLCEKYRS
ncbi:hypothetical protein [uncultured Dokdonia sp.]|uniref:hypothetical protein n=1 Tax=uncultured Dokdonia sp. TaxID=575653 RepID=UPI0026232BA1|nr:hypothetical protein [uncultured Dokdonia sp.]